jgi:hypothetical protein
VRSAPRHECRLEFHLRHRGDIPSSGATNVISIRVWMIEVTLVASRRLAPDSHPPAVAVRRALIPADEAPLRVHPLGAVRLLRLPDHAAPGRA